MFLMKQEQISQSLEDLETSGIKIVVWYSSYDGVEEMTNKDIDFLAILIYYLREELKGRLGTKTTA